MRSQETFEQITAAFSEWQEDIKAVYRIDRDKVGCPNLYDILNSRKVQDYLSRDRIDCSSSVPGEVNLDAEKRWDIAYHNVLGSQKWQNAKPDFCAAIGKALLKAKSILTEAPKAEAYCQFLGLLPPTKAVKLKPDFSEEVLAQAETLVAQAIQHYQSKAYQETITTCDRVLQIQPKHAEAYYYRGLARCAFGEFGDLREALSDYSRAIQYNPGFANAYYQRGTIYKKIGGNVRNAIADFQTAAEHYQKQNNLRMYREAIEQAKSLKNDPNPLPPKPDPSIPSSDTPQNQNNQAQTYYNRGKQYEHQKKYRNALEQYTSAIEHDPNFAEAYLGQAVAYYNLEKYQKAIPACDHAVKIKPKYAEAYYYRGLARCAFGEFGDLREALSDYNQAIRFNPTFADAFYHRGLLHQRNGGSEIKATADIETAAELYQQQGNQEMYRKAIAQVRKNTTISPGGKGGQSVVSRIGNFLFCCWVLLFLIKIALPIVFQSSPSKAPPNETSETLKRICNELNVETNRRWGKKYPGRIDRNGNPLPGKGINRSQEPEVAKEWDKIKQDLQQRCSEG
jgi:tetratricopeptide (TPR) repeat protein